MAFIKRWLFRLLLVLVFVVALLAASDNSEAVRLTFLSYQTPQWPISYWMLTAFVFGVLFGTVLNMVSNAKLRMTASKANREVAKTSRELDQVKATTLSAPDS